MARVLSVCIFLSFGIFKCLSQVQEPSVGEYILEAVDYLNRTHWRFFLPDDTDIDQDGNLSDLEVQQKFNSYVGELFKMMDQDKDNSITEEEMRYLELDISHLTKVVDIALENFPLRPFFLAADANRDGVYDENDFYLPEKVELPNIASAGETMIELNDHTHIVHRGRSHQVVNIGPNEGNVICKSLGYVGLEKVVSHQHTYYKFVTSYSCDGTEARLEDCQRVANYSVVNGLVCQGPKKLGAVRLVGGKDSSSGDIFFGNKGLGCDYFENKHNIGEVVCRELGYSGVLQMTSGSAFTGKEMEQGLSYRLNCNGTEQRVEDCQRYISSCTHIRVYGVICATDERPGMNEGLSDLINWPYSASTWEQGGRFLMVADVNADGKLTLQELATKSKQLLTKILELLDMNQDRKLSLEDLTLNLSLGPIMNLVMELFEVVTGGRGEFDLYNMKISGQDMSNIWGNGLNGQDIIKDKKLNAADLFQHLDDMEKATYLIPMLSQKLDKNQDGKIQSEELTQFIEEMFNQLDMDKNGALTLEDVYGLLRENGLDCLEVGALRSYIKAFVDTVDNEIRDFFSYVFHQLDKSGWILHSGQISPDGKISPTELEQMYVICEQYEYGNRDYDNDSSEDNSDEDAELYARKGCGYLEYFGSKISVLIRYFPESIFSESRGRGGQETLVDKMKNRACEMLI